MSRLFVDSIRCGITAGSRVCGPIEGHPVAEAAIRDVDTGTVTFCTAVELFGRICFYETPVSVFEGFTETAKQTADFRLLLARHEIAKYRDAAELYEDLEEGFISSADDEVKRKFLYYCLQADQYDLRTFMQRNAGLYLNNMIIPATDAEEEYLEQREEEELWEEEEDGIF